MHWVNPSGRPVETCTIITTDANALVSELHNRMPAIIAPCDYGAWLDACNPDAQQLLKSFPSEQLISYPVSLRVNNGRNDDAECIAPLPHSRSEIHHRHLMDTIPGTMPGRPRSDLCRYTMKGSQSTFIEAVELA